MEYISFIVTMYRESDDYEFGIEVKVRKSDIVRYRTPLWAIAGRKATEEAHKLEAEIISIEKLDLEGISAKFER